MVERSLSMREVPGSIPGISIPFINFEWKYFQNRLFLWQFFCFHFDITWKIQTLVLDHLTIFDNFGRSNLRSDERNHLIWYYLMIILFQITFSWRWQREMIVRAHFIVSSDHSTDFRAVYPIIYHMICQNSCSIYGKRNEAPWISPDPYLSI